MPTSRLSCLLEPKTYMFFAPKSYNDRLRRSILVMGVTLALPPVSTRPFETCFLIKVGSICLCIFSNLSIQQVHLQVMYPYQIPYIFSSFTPYISNDVPQPGTRSIYQPWLSQVPYGLDHHVHGCKNETYC